MATHRLVFNSILCPFKSSSFLTVLWTRAWNSRPPWWLDKAPWTSVWHLLPELQIYLYDTQKTNENRYEKQSIDTYMSDRKLQILNTTDVLYNIYTACLSHMFIFLKILDLADNFMGAVAASGYSGGGGWQVGAMWYFEGQIALK